MNRHHVIIAAIIAVASSATALADGMTTTGAPRVIDGRTMEVAGKQVTLAHIAVPPIGGACHWRGKPFDCGELARAGLMDLTAGAIVSCRSAAGGHICMSGGYDLAFGLVHAGWAVPLADAPQAYFDKMREAERRGRGLWSAVDNSGGAIPASLLVGVR